MPRRILLLPGDGIGPEVVEQAQRVLIAAASVFNLDLVFDSASERHLVKQPRLCSLVRLLKGGNSIFTLQCNANIVQSLD